MRREHTLVFLVAAVVALGMLAAGPLSGWARSIAAAVALTVFVLCLGALERPTSSPTTPTGAPVDPPADDRADIPLEDPFEFPGAPFDDHPHDFAADYDSYHDHTGDALFDY